MVGNIVELQKSRSTAYPSNESANNTHWNRLLDFKHDSENEADGAQECQGATEAAPSSSSVFRRTRFGSLQKSLPLPKICNDIDCDFGSQSERGNNLELLTSVVKMKQTTIRNRLEKQKGVTYDQTSVRLGLRRILEIAVAIS
jgi:hypothetical protein